MQTKIAFVQILWVQPANRFPPVMPSFHYHPVIADEWKTVIHFQFGGCEELQSYAYVEFSDVLKYQNFFG